MPTPNSYPPFPALYLYPLNDSFVPKQISLAGGQHVKIGRQTNAKTVPGDRNGYFDSKVLSRQHAEVWEEGGKIYIKDVKSSNGTFVNQERLSPEGVESDPYELKTDDMVEFGIDIVGEDNKTIIHHKVSARVTCVFTAEEALAAQREMYTFHHHHQAGQQALNGPAGTLGSAQQRRPALPQANGLSGIGGMGGGMRQPGSKSHINFDAILQKLQGELQKSRETHQELGVVNSSMNEVMDVLSGAQPTNLPTHSSALPPVRPPQQNAQDSESAPNTVLQSLQNQLADTQASLSTQVEKIRSLESVLSEYDAIRREVNALRDLIVQRDRDHHMMQHRVSDHDHDDSDRSSIHTIVPHELESVPEEDEMLEQEETEEERSARREELGRPRTPEPTSLGMRDDDELDDDHHRSGDSHRDAPPQPPGIPDDTSHRLAVLTEQLESAIELSRTLQAQHSAAQQTIEALQSKVNSLEELVRSSQDAKAADEAKQAEEAARRERDQRDNMTALFAEFKKTIEDRWDLVRHDWEAEHERMEKARGEWDNKLKTLEDGFSVASGKFEIGLAELATRLANMTTNGHLSMNLKKNKSGLQTPPSPRSLSDADSDSDGPTRSRRKRSRSSSRQRRQGKSRSRSPATSASATLVDGLSIDGRDGEGHSRSASGSPSLDSVEQSPQKAKFPRFPPTPESSVHLDEKSEAVAIQKDSATALQGQGVTQAQVAIGVFVLGVATAAVLWRVKE